MELSPTKLLAMCGLLFGGIVLIGVAAQQTGNEEFKNNFISLDFSALRSRLNREEGISADEPEPVEVEDTDEG